RRQCLGDRAHRPDRDGQPRHQQPALLHRHHIQLSHHGRGLPHRCLQRPEPAGLTMSNGKQERAAGRSLAPLRALWPFIARYRGVFYLAIGALVIASAALLALPVAVRFLIDRGMAAGDAGTVNRYFLAFLGAAVVLGVFAALRFYLVTWLGE